RADAVGRAARDHVAGIQRENAGQEADYVSFVPDQVLRVAVLLHDPVDLRDDPEVRWIRRELFRENERSERRRPIAALAAEPVRAGKHAGQRTAGSAAIAQ